MILDKIVAAKKKRLPAQKECLPLEDIKLKLKEQSRTKEARMAGCFARALTSASVTENTKRISLIAEVKKASPSQGLICEDFAYLRIASQYEQAGAAAISVLTEEDYFGGSSAYLREIRAQVQIPLLRKDFIIDPYQIYEAKLWGADAILLIARLLDDSQIKEFLKVAGDLDLDCLLETHNEQEVQRAIAAGAKIIGINNRDLQTFQVSLENSRRLGELIPKGIIKVSESGIHTAQDIRSVLEWGFDAVLVGEALMKAGNIAGKFAELQAGMENYAD